MTLGSCRVKKEDSVGAGPQNMFVNLFLMAQYAGQSNTKWCSSSAKPEAQKTQWRCSLGTCCVKGINKRPWGFFFFCSIFFFTCICIKACLCNWSEMQPQHFPDDTRLCCCNGFLELTIDLSCCSGPRNPSWRTWHTSAHLGLQHQSSGKWADGPESLKSTEALITCLPALGKAAMHCSRKRLNTPTAVGRQQLMLRYAWTCTNPRHCYVDSELLCPSCR